MASKLILYRGRRGSGKTLSMVREAYKYYLNGWKVLRNFKCAFGQYISDEEILKLDKKADIHDCVLMIDELQILFDSRRSMKKENITFSNFIQQIRKRNIILLGATQYVGTVDLRFRQHCDIVAVPNFIKSIEVCELTYIDVTSIEDNILGELPALPSIKFVYDARPIFKLFDTNELIA